MRIWERHEPKVSAYLCGYVNACPTEEEKAVAANTPNLVLQRMILPPQASMTTVQQSMQAVFAHLEREPVLKAADTVNYQLVETSAMQAPLPDAGAEVPSLLSDAFLENGLQ